VSTLALAAVSGLWWESGVALSANHLFTLVLSGEGSQGGLNFDASESTSSEAQHQVKGRFFLNVVVGQGASIFELLSCENQALLIRGDSFLILNFGPTTIRPISTTALT